MIAKTMIAEIKFAPPVNWCVFDPAKIILSKSYITGQTNKIPNNPYTTEGIPANNSIADLTIFLTLGLANSAKLIAVNTPIGTPIQIARKTPTIDVKIIKSIPYCGSAAVGAQTVPKEFLIIPL